MNSDWKKSNVGKPFEGQAPAQYACLHEYRLLEPVIFFCFLQGPAAASENQMNFKYYCFHLYLLQHQINEFRKI